MISLSSKKGFDAKFKNDICVPLRACEEQTRESYSYKGTKDELIRPALSVPGALPAFNTTHHSLSGQPLFLDIEERGVLGSFRDGVVDSRKDRIGLVVFVNVKLVDSRRDYSLLRFLCPTIGILVKVQLHVLSLVLIGIAVRHRPIIHDFSLLYQRCAWKKR